MGKEKISILVVRDIGKAKSYRISFGLFKKIVVLAVVLFLFTVASVFGFFHLYWDRKEMQKGIERLTRQVELAKRQVKKHDKNLKETRKLLALLKVRPEQGSEKKSESRALPGADKESMEKSNAKKPLEFNVVNQVMDIRDFKKIKDQDTSRLKVIFGLYNQDPQHRVVEGRIIMVATKDQPGSPIHISYPQASLSSGRPINMKMGYRFAIRRFKQIEGYIERPSIDLRFDKVTIFVYSLDGNLILEEAFIIEDK